MIRSTDGSSAFYPWTTKKNTRIDRGSLHCRAFKMTCCALANSTRASDLYESINNLHQDSASTRLTSPIKTPHSRSASNLLRPLLLPSSHPDPLVDLQGGSDREQPLHLVVADLEQARLPAKTARQHLAQHQTRTSLAAGTAARSVIPGRNAQNSSSSAG